MSLPRGRRGTVEAARSGGAFDRVSRRGLVFDGAVGLVIAGLMAFSTYLYTQMAAVFGFDPPSTLMVFAGVTMCLVLALRRIYPITVFVVVSVAFSVYGFAGGYDVLVASVALFIATVAVGSHGSPRVRDWARGIVIVGLFGTIIYAFVAVDGEDAPLLAFWFGQAYTLALNIVFFAAAWYLGDQIRIRRHRETQLAERTAELTARQLELEAERERSAEKAAVEERLRIARELHDALGHHVSVMGVQAGAARRVLEQQPEVAADVLEGIERSSRKAVSEVQRALRLLRDDNGPTAAGTLGRLDEFAEELRHADITVTVQVDAHEDIPIEVELAVLRIVQESLTNVVRHAGPGSSAWVKVQRDGVEVRVEVADDGRGEPPIDQREPDGDGRSRGTGLRGIRERVEVHGGTFAAGRDPAGGWRVTVTLPLEADVTVTGASTADVATGDRR